MFFDPFPEPSLEKPGLNMQEADAAVYKEEVGSHLLINGLCML